MSQYSYGENLVMDVDILSIFNLRKTFEIIAKNNIKIIGPESGELASGLTGKSCR